MSGEAEQNVFVRLCPSTFPLKLPRARAIPGSLGERKGAYLLVVLRDRDARQKIKRGDAPQEM